MESDRELELHSLPEAVFQARSKQLEWSGLEVGLVFPGKQA